MGRRRIRPERGPEHGIARGNIQRVILAELLRGTTLKVPVTAMSTGKRGPAGMTKAAWQGMQARMSERGYRVERGNDDYAGGMYDTYRLTRLVDGSDVTEVR